MRILLVVAAALAACTIDVNIDKNSDALSQDGREPDITDASPSLDATFNDASPFLDATLEDASPPLLDATLEDASTPPDAAL